MGLLRSSRGRSLPAVRPCRREPPACHAARMRDYSLGLRLGTKIMLLEAFVLAALWLAATVSWVAREQDRLDEQPAQEALALQNEVLGRLRGELASQPD